MLDTVHLVLCVAVLCFVCLCLLLCWRGRKQADKEGTRETKWETTQETTHAARETTAGESTKGLMIEEEEEDEPGSIQTDKYDLNDSDTMPLLYDQFIEDGYLSKTG